MQQDTADLLKRTAIALIGQGLPRLAVLSVMARHVKKGCFYLVASAILVSAFLVANLYALYEYLLWRGLSNLEAFLVVDGITLLFILIAKMLVCKHFSRIHPMKCHSRCRSRKQHPEENLVISVIEAFMEGLQEKRCQSCQKETCDCPKP